MKLVLAVLLALTAIPAARADEPVKIAFVDTGNTGRSVIAEALADGLVREKRLHIAVIGRGVDVDPFNVYPEAGAATVLQRQGIDVAEHRAAPLTARDIKHADLVLTMTAKHKATIVALYPDAAAKVFTLAEYAAGTHADVADAYGKPLEEYEAVYKQIADYIPAALDKAARK